jgi:DNA-binding transcriptional LysR family regulator
MLGVAVLERTSRGVRPTPAGLALVTQSRQVLQQVGRLAGELSEYAKGLKGRVRLHANTSSLTQFLPEQLASFSTKYPDIRLEIEERRSQDIVRSVAAGEADVGVIVQSPVEGLETWPYRVDQLAAVLPRRHPVRKRAIAFDALLEYDFACLDSSTAITRTLLAAAERANRPLRIRVQVWGFEAMCRLVQAGLGIGVMPQGAAATFANALGLRVVPLSDPWALRQHVIGVRALDALPVHARRLVEHLRAS